MIAPVVYVILAGVLAGCVAFFIHDTAEPRTATGTPRPAAVRPSPRPQAPPWPAAPRPVPAFTPWPHTPAGRGQQDLAMVELQALAARQKAAADRPDVWTYDTGSFAAVHFGGQR